MHTKTYFDFMLMTLGIPKWLLVLLFSFNQNAIAPPLSDNCATPSIIQIEENGYATGTFISQRVDISEATIVFGEHFDNSQILAANDKKSIWYQFYLPTAREVKLELFQPGNDIAVKDAGFTTYYATECLPGAAEITAAKLTPLPKFGSTSHPCLDPGFYLIQVSASEDANAEIFMQLDIAPSFTNDDTDAIRYDFPVDAYAFGLINDNQNQRIQYDFGCHSIDNPEEFNCLPVANPSEYTQSSWHTFTTNDHVDLINIEVQTTRNAAPDTLGYRLYKGDVSQTQIEDLEIIEECTVFQNVNTRRIKEHACELAPNTTYSFQLLFHQDYFNENLRVYVRERGEKAGAAPLPLATQTDRVAFLGVLPQSDEGIRTSYVDNFGCNTRLSLPENQCGNLQNEPFYNPTDSNLIYDLSNWMTFELGASAEVTVDVNGYSNYRYIRVFRGAFVANCTEFLPNADLIYQGTFRDFTLQCLIPDNYSVQFLGSSVHPNQKNDPNRYYPLWEEGNLGRTINVNLIVKGIQAISRFALQDSFAIDAINLLNPLQIANSYQMAADTFGCSDTPIPEDGTCDIRTKAIFRTFNIGDADGDMQLDSGIIQISNMQTHPNRGDVHYKLYSGNLQTNAIAQNTFNPGDTIRGVNNYLDGCITNNHSGGRGFFCVVPNDYTLTSFGGDAQRNESDQPAISFRILNTKYNSRQHAEDLGDITDSTIVISDSDVFSCLDNPDTIGGLAPCGNATKLIYRQFYINETKIAKFEKEGSGTFRLYQGQANDLTANLIPWEGLRENGRPWTSCFSDQTTSDCRPLPAGWYTVVAYGTGASYDRPSMGGSDGIQNDLGQLNTLNILFEPADVSLYNRPYKAYDADTTDWNFAAANDLYPQTKVSYTLGTETFTCIPDTPFVTHPIITCNPIFNRVAYYVFTITAPSYISFKGISGDYYTRVYRLDVRQDSTSLLTVEPVYPCLANSYREICGLDPGTYTLAIFANDAATGSSVTPVIAVDKLGTARFDHAQKAYDFAAVPNDGVWYNGRVGDVHPVNDSLAPCHDIIYCSTGAQIDDPTDDVCQSGYNEAVYSSPLLYQDTLPQKGHTLRNVWYTFTLSGAGRANIKINHYNQTRPLMSVYSSDVDASIPFINLQANGGIDSTKMDGLSLLSNNFVRCNRDRNPTISFNRTGCQPTPNRYYVVVTQWHDSEPNQPVDIEIQYEGEAVPPAQYDHYSEVNVINSLNQIATPYTEMAIGDGKYQGAPMSFQCLTRDETDPWDNTCYNRSAWYKFETDISGQVRIAYENLNDATDKNKSDNMRLYRETVAGDSTTLVLVNQNRFRRNNPLNDTNHDWNEACLSPGTYYLFWVACNDEFDVFGTYQPLIWLYQNEGDYCETAIPFALNGVGTADTTLRVDCHTIGEGFGEDGDGIGCLFGPEGYKSSWFKLTLTNNEKVDVTFDLRENTTAFPSQIRYRILTGFCNAMTSGPCNTDANTVFTLNCMVAGDYFVQVVTPAAATGTLDLAVSSIPASEDLCIPQDPTLPVANFTYENDCASDTIFFQNQSTAGSAVSYLWSFPDGSTSVLEDPIYLHPRTDIFQTIEIDLTVTNDSLMLRDTVSIPIFILPEVDLFADAPALACNGDTSTLNLSNIENASFLWQDGSTADTLTYSEPGLYWVEVFVNGCTLRDSVRVEARTCVFMTIDTSFCENIAFSGVFFERDTSFDQVFSLPNGVDSIVTTNIHLFPTKRTVRDTAICAGETLMVGNSVYNSAGTYTNLFATTNQCDSIVVTNLTVHALPAPDILGEKPFCDGDSIFLFIAGSYESYQWINQATTNGIWVKQGGTYEVTVIDTNGCVGLENKLIDAPIILSSDIAATTSYNGFDISCSGLSDGAITVTPTNGIAPYTYRWDDQQTTATATNLSVGVYLVTLTDATGCQTTNTLTLEEPPPLMVDLMPFPIQCADRQDGAISVAIAGETAPYLYAINDGQFSNNNLFDNLKGGEYTIQVKDANNCVWEGVTEVTEPAPLTLNATPNYMELSLGDSIELEAVTNATNIASIHWSPDKYMDCDSCLAMTIKPMTSVTYTVELITDEGCTVTSEATLRVSNDNRIYIPNVFAPAGNDERNQRFTIFAGPEVVRINSLMIVDRWGELMYEHYNFPPNDLRYGWDGLLNGEALNPAVFVFKTEVALINGETKQFTGSLTLVNN